MKSQENMVFCESLTKIYRGIDSKINQVVLKSIDLSISKYTMTGIFGPSGSGKSTLLNILAGFLNFEAGEVRINNISLNDRTRINISTLWKNIISLVFQFPERNIFSSLTVKENLVLSNADSSNTIEKILDQVNLSNYEDRLVKNLSGGEMQRLAISMVLARKTPILLADEPTGELDKLNSEKIFQVLRKIVNEEDITCIVVSHNLSLVKYCDNKFKLRNGKIEEF